MLPLLYLYVETSVYRHTFLHICVHSSFSVLSLVESIVNPTAGCIFRKELCLAFRCVENVVIEVTHLILCPPQMEVTGMLLGPDTGVQCTQYPSWSKGFCVILMITIIFTSASADYCIMGISCQKGITEVHKFYSWVGLLISLFLWQLAQHLQVLLELVLGKEACRSVPTLFPQGLCQKCVVSLTKAMKLCQQLCQNGKESSKNKITWKVTVSKVSWTV